MIKVNNEIRPLTREEQLRTYLETLKLILKEVNKEIEQTQEEIKTLKKERE